MKTCLGGIWSCIAATPKDIEDYPSIAELRSACSAVDHLELSTCEPVTPRTCRTMHQKVDQSPAICQAGCVCKSGYVLDAPSGKCVLESECPCYHGGRSYKDGDVMQEECNTCTCTNGKWKCTEIVCPGMYFILCILIVILSMENCFNNCLIQK